MRKIARFGGLLAAGALFAACGSDDGEPLGQPSPAATETPTAELNPDPEDDLAGLWSAYWAAVVVAENDLDTDADQFNDVMTEQGAQQHIDYIQGLIDNDLFRAGEPDVGEPEFTLDDGTAMIEGCVDHAAWAIGSNTGARVQQMFPAGPHPYVVEAERQDDGQWLITRTFYGNNATITCEAP
jgi:hypothetical protein